MKHHWVHRAACFGMAAMMAAATVQAESTRQHHGVILLYHHVSDQTPASTSVTPTQFEHHLDYLAEHDYQVWPLERLLQAVLRGTETVPERVVSITFDDAYESVFTTARPRLAGRDWPYTVFVNTDAVDAGYSPYMGWDQLKILAAEGVAIENHSATHGHLSRPAGNESRDAWRSRVATDIARARSRITDEIGRAPSLFAYPYGEDSVALAEVVGETHDFGMAQRSGPVGPLSDPLSVPRFPMATGFASLERLELAVRSRPLPVVEVDALVADETTGDIQSLQLHLAGNGFRANQLNCFAATGERLEATVEGEIDGPVEIRVDVRGIGVTGRNKINCTAPAADGSGDFFWFSWQWLVDRSG